MTDATKSQTVDSDLPYYCAFCFPGVMLTLGAENWPLLRTTFLTLSGDLQVCVTHCVESGGGGEVS